MKTTIRVIVLLVVSLALGFAAYQIIQPLNPSVTFGSDAGAAIAQGGSAGQGQGGSGGAQYGRGDAHGVSSGGAAGHQEGGPGGSGSMLLIVLGKFLAIFVGIAGVSAIVHALLRRRGQPSASAAVR